jgi:hypothetical protein
MKKPEARMMRPSSDRLILRSLEKRDTGNGAHTGD